MDRGKRAQRTPTYYYYANTDFWHYLYRENKPMMNHDVSISGGTKKMKYLLSGGYNWEKGMIKKSSDIFKKPISVPNFRLM